VFHYVWTKEDVINALSESGLEVNKINFETIENYDYLPVSAKEIVKFTISLEVWDHIEL